MKLVGFWGLYGRLAGAVSQSPKWSSPQRVDWAWRFIWKLRSKLATDLNAVRRTALQLMQSMNHVRVSNTGFLSARFRELVATAAGHVVADLVTEWFSHYAKRRIFASQCFLGESEPGNLPTCSV